ncbi:ribosomal protein L7/L12 [Paenibacillus xylanilyticus]|uniref:ribosomal protein L7/L12 n=1 Tax=Paenibacillus xylanilyticus TaxID=248903 RepID=UPI00129E2884|nr:ribosomal protein L7/L12 [Paenibacillus xylanilyticus]
MEINTIFLIVLLLLIVILLTRVISLQSQLNELKRDVERIENAGITQRTPSSSFNYSVSSSTLSSSSEQPTELSELDQELILMIQQGNKIKAIKKLREARNLSLKDAKDYVDTLERTSS